MSLVFDIKKTAQCLAHIIKNLEGQQATILKLIKLLYLADREALKKNLHTITGDKHCAMRNGPVLSHTYDLLKNPIPAHIPKTEKEYWNSIFSKRGNTIYLASTPQQDHLSNFDIKILDSVIQEHGKKTANDLVTLTHRFSEWKDNQPGNSSKPIPISDILKAIGHHKASESATRKFNSEQKIAKFLGPGI